MKQKEDKEKVWRRCAWRGIDSLTHAFELFYRVPFALFRTKLSNL